MKIYPELKNQTFIRIPRSGLVQFSLPFTGELLYDYYFNIQFWGRATRTD